MAPFGSHREAITPPRYADFVTRRLVVLALLLAVASVARAAEPPPPGLGHDHPLAGRIWDVAHGRFVPMTALLTFYRAAFFYGTSRWIAWTIWAHVVHHYPYDLSWGGPHWVHAAHP